MYKKSDEPEDLFPGTKKNKPGPGDKEKSASARSESASHAEKEQIQPTKYDYRKHPR